MSNPLPGDPIPATPFPNQPVNGVFAVVEHRSVGSSAENTSLFSFTTGIDPVPTSSLPELYAHQKRLDVFPLSYDADGNVVSILAWGETTNRGWSPGGDYQETTVVPPPAGAKPGATLSSEFHKVFDPTVLDKLEVVVEAVDGPSTLLEHTTKILDGLKTVIRDGHFVYEVKYHSRLEAHGPTPGGEGPTDYSLGIETFITYRRDGRMEIEIAVLNDLYSVDLQGQTNFHFVPAPSP